MAHADDYPIVIRRADNGYVAEAAALGLTRTGSDINMLEAGMRASVAEILAVCERHGAHVDPAREREATVARSTHRRTIIGAMAAVLVVVIVSMPLMWGYQRLSAFLSSSTERLNATGMQRLLTDGVRRTADTLEMITPERRDQLSHDFGRIARALEPYAAQLRPLLVSSPPSPPPPAERRP
jgi:hypothetical protein